MKKQPDKKCEKKQRPPKDSLAEFQKKYPGVWEEILRLFGVWKQQESS